MSYKERTGWRDLGLSSRHRKWGRSLAMVDMDFVEYKRNGIPVAIIEYKNEHATELLIKDFQKMPNYNCLRNIGTQAGIPVLIVVYGDNYGWWKIGALNSKGFEVAGDLRGRKISEREYVRFLYKLRGEELPSHMDEVYFDSIGG